MTKWEYTTVSNHLRLDWPELNKYGEQGWELVAVAVDVSAGHTRDYWYTFKRPMAPTQE